jgi:DNA-binding CsgD family transcriptional regulator
MHIAMSTARPAQRLTPRQDEVLALLLAGQTNKQIARTLQISPFTVRAHVAAVMQQFGAKRRQDLARLSQGAAPPDGMSMEQATAAASFRHWALPALGLVLIAAALVLLMPNLARPRTTWSAVNVVPETVVLRSPEGARGTDIRVTMQPTPALADHAAFLAYSRQTLDAAMWADGLVNHRFDRVQIKSLECLAYAGASRPRGTNPATAYIHERGYFCPHPTRATTAIHVRALADGRTRDFAGGEALRAVLMDLAESAASR